MQLEHHAENQWQHGSWSSCRAVGDSSRHWWPTELVLQRFILCVSRRTSTANPLQRSGSVNIATSVFSHAYIWLLRAAMVSVQNFVLPLTIVLWKGNCFFNDYCKHSLRRERFDEESVSNSKHVLTVERRRQVLQANEERKSNAVYSKFKSEASETQEIDDFFNFENIHSKRESMAFDSIAFTRHGSISDES